MSNLLLMRTANNRVIFLASIALIVVDQVLKAAALRYLPDPGDVQGGLIVLAASANLTPRLGVEAALPLLVWLAGAAVIWLLGRGQDWPRGFVWGVMLALAGAGSNAVNWIAPGYVVDYIWITAPGIVGNFADLMAVGGWLMAIAALAVERFSRKGCGLC